MSSLDPTSTTLVGPTPDSTQPNDPVDCPIDPRQYVTCLLECYVQLPHTPDRPQKHDRYLARRIFNQNVPLDTVKAAFVLATSRRRFRPDDAFPLEPIRSLAYFLPVIKELQRTPPDRDYIHLLKQRLHSGFPDLGIPPLDPPIPW